MRKNDLIKLLSVCLICLFVFAIPGLLYSQKHPSELKLAKAVKFIPPSPEKFEVGEGITVYFIEDKELPFVSMYAYFKGGSFFDPADKTGLAVLTATVMRTSGTAKRTGNEIDEELGFLAEDIQLGASTEYFGVSFDSLKKNFPRILETCADILMYPAFNQEKIDLAKNQTKQRIKNRWNNPNSYGQLLFNRLLFGADGPSERMPTFSCLDHISRDDMVQCHKKYFVPNNMFIALSGDIPSSEVKEVLNKTFGDWKPKPVEFPKVPKEEDKSKSLVYYVQKDIPQAQVILGHFCDQNQDSPDLQKIQVFNYVFGGGLSSRLNEELRVKRGWTYGASGYIGLRKDNGSFQVATALKAEILSQALVVIKETARRMQTESITDEELERAKNALIYGSIFQYQSKFRIISSKIVRLHIQGKEEIHEDERLEKIRNVTKKDVLEIAKKYINLDRLTILIIGNKNKFDKPLENFGNVEEINLQEIQDRDQAGMKQPDREKTKKSIIQSAQAELFTRVNEAPAEITVVNKPAYEKSKGPRVLFDEGHYNHHKSNETYSAFVRIIMNDGYVVTANQSKFTEDVLKGSKILVISNALNEKNENNWQPPYFPAFTLEEIEVVHSWVKGGGALLLIADHQPFGTAAFDLAKRFGVILGQGTAFDLGTDAKDFWITFSREKGTLLDHPVINGRNESEKANKVQTFGGESLQAPKGSGFLKLTDKAFVVFDNVTTVGQLDKVKKTPVPGQYQGAAFAYGASRIVVLGEAGVVTWQGFDNLFKRQITDTKKMNVMGINPQENDNKQLLLNIMHYLSGILEPGVLVSSEH